MKTASEREQELREYASALNDARVRDKRNLEIRMTRHIGCCFKYEGDSQVEYSVIKGVSDDCKVIVGRMIFTRGCFEFWPETNVDESFLKRLGYEIAQDEFAKGCKDAIEQIINVYPVTNDENPSD